MKVMERMRRAGMFAVSACVSAALYTIVCAWAIARGPLEPGLLMLVSARWFDPRRVVAEQVEAARQGREIAAGGENRVATRIGEGR